MEKFVIIADSTSDIPKELRDKYNIEIIPLCINIGEDIYKDGVELSTVELFDLAEKKKTLPKTSAIAPDEFIEVFKKHLNQEKKVLFIGIGSGFSATLQNAHIAFGEFEKNVYIVDSEKLSIGTGFVVLKACELREEGKSIDEIVKVLNEYKTRVRTYFAISTLEYLHKGGRCSGTARLFGAMLKITPIIRVALNKMEVAKKPRGRYEKALDEMLVYFNEDLKKNNVDLNKVVLIYPHPKALNDVEYMKKELHKLGVKDFITTTAGCTISTHCGPRTIGLAYVVKQ
ncbi:MAG: DegV family protein [Bacilli bacterium]|jgi:DegV family protein with EDD domain